MTAMHTLVAVLTADQVGVIQHEIMRVLNESADHPGRRSFPVIAWLIFSLKAIPA